MISLQQNRIDFSDAGKSIRILSVVYASRQKQQKSNLTKIDAGAIGLVKVRIWDPSFNNEYYLIQLSIEGQIYYCKLARTMIEFI